jgi:hypothetical protein
MREAGQRPDCLALVRRRLPDRAASFVAAERSLLCLPQARAGVDEGLHLVRAPARELVRRPHGDAGLLKRVHALRGFVLSGLAEPLRELVPRSCELGKGPPEEIVELALELRDDGEARAHAPCSTGRSSS